MEKDGDKEKVVLAVSVDAPEGALPPNTTMKIDGVDADKVASDLKAAISYDANLKGKAMNPQKSQSPIPLVSSFPTLAGRALVR